MPAVAPRKTGVELCRWEGMASVIFAMQSFKLFHVFLSWSSFLPRSEIPGPWKDTFYYYITFCNILFKLHYYCITAYVKIVVKNNSKKSIKELYLSKYPQKWYFSSKKGVLKCLPSTCKLWDLLYYVVLFLK